MEPVTAFDQNISDDTRKELTAMDTAIYKANEKMKFLANDKKCCAFIICVRWHRLTITAA